MKNLKITLVGAGPGDPELITLKGIKAIGSADVILYDALANDALLGYARPDALLIFVGKRAGQHSFQQQEINRLLVRYAQQYGHVVRLKGGDPFVFGRGQEEKEYALGYGIPTEVVPGISSALAVPAANDIPLTKRGVSESFWVLTGTTKDEELSSDLELAAESKATVVILMGMKHLPLIAELFATYRGPDEAVAIIQNGTCHNQRMGLGTLMDIEAVAREKGLTSPAVIVIGPVVKEHPAWVQEQVLAIVGG